MGKKSIIFCDLTKQEILEGDEIVSITIKRQDKKSGRTYELSSEAAATLEQQLVAGKELQLQNNWFFSDKTSVILDTTKPVVISKLGDLDDDEKFVAQKRRELTESGRLTEEVELPSKPVISSVMDHNNDSCKHINKGRVETTLREGKRFAYQKCSACNKKIEVMSAESRKAYMNGKLPADINVRSID